MIVSQLFWLLIISIAHSETFRSKRQASPCCTAYGQACTVGVTNCCPVGRWPGGTNYCYGGSGGTCDCSGPQITCTPATAYICCTGICGANGFCDGSGLAGDGCDTSGLDGFCTSGLGLTCVFPSPNPQVATSYPASGGYPWGTCEYNSSFITYDTTLICSGTICCPGTTSTTFPTTTTTGTTSTTLLTTTTTATTSTSTSTTSTTTSTITTTGAPCANMFSTGTGTITPGPYLSGMSYSFSCTTNFWLPATNSISMAYSCLNGIWSQTFVPCQATCPMLPSLSGGNITYLSVTNNIPNSLNRSAVGAVAIIQCYPGYQISGPNQTTCSSGGSWTSQSPNVQLCARIECPNMFSSATGTPDPGPYYALQSYNFSCLSGFLPQNASLTSYSCDQMGKWSNAFSPCISSSQCVCQAPQDECESVCGVKPRCKYDSGSGTCECKDEWESVDCSMLKFPTKWQGILMLTIKSIDCTATVILLAISVVSNVLLKNFSPEIVLAINTDFALMLVHLLILTNRVPYLMDISLNSCAVVSLFCHWFITAHFTFLFFESLQTYTTLTGVVHNGYYLPLIPTLILGWGLPLLVTGFTAAAKFHDYSVGWSCLVNYSSTVAYGIVLPIAVISWICVVHIDATYADSRDYKKLLKVNRSQYISATVALFHLLIYTITSITAFILTTLAVFTIDEYLFSIAIILNTTMAAIVLFFRVLTNSKVRSFCHKCKTGRKSSF